VRASTSGGPGLIGPISVRGVAGVPGGCGCLRCCTWEAGGSAGRGLFFVGMTGFSGDHGVWRSCSHVRSGGGCAHGSRTALAADSAVPHDSAVPTDAGCTRMCNTHHPRAHGSHEGTGRATHVRPARLTRPPAPRTTPPETLTHVSDVLTHRNLDVEVDRSRRGVRPISSRNWTDLGAGYDRFRAGSGPISARRATDLGGERG